MPEGCVPLYHLDICDDCQRSQAIGHQQQNDLYLIEFNQKGSETIIQRRNFKNVNAYTGTNSRCVYKLFKECDSYIDKDNSNTSFGVGWCSHVWSVLLNEDIYNQYEDYIWRFIPLEWIMWWLQSL